MKKSIIIVSIVMFWASQIFAQNDYHVYFNEVRANDQGGDDAEFIEIVGPAGTDLTGFVIVHYNGNNGQDGGIWTHTIGSFTIPDDGVTDTEGNSIGYYVVSDTGVPNTDATLPANIQNGPDGLVLYDTDGTTILDAMAWQGAGDMTTDDPGTVTTGGATTANNYLHVTVDDDGGNNSLEAPNDVVGDDGSGWINTSATPGAINSGQTSGDVILPVELTYFNATAITHGVQLDWRTESEIENLGFILERKTADSDWTEIASYKTDDALLGQGTISSATDYQHVDELVQQGTTYAYRLADVDYNGIVTYHSTREVFVESAPLPSVVENFSVLAFPNPFNPTTTIRYSIPSNSADVHITVYDLTGRLVNTLVNTVQSAGVHEVQWNGNNNLGEKVPGGVYLTRIAVGNQVKTNKLIMLK